MASVADTFNNGTAFESFDAKNTKNGNAEDNFDHWPAAKVIKAPNQDPSLLGGKSLSELAAQTAAEPHGSSDQLTSHGIGRFAEITGRGLTNIGGGLAEAATNAPELLKTAGESLVIGAAFKALMPEGGISTKLLGAGLGAVYVGKSLWDFGPAYVKGFEAKNEQEMDSAGREWAHTAGDFVVNTAVAGVGLGVGGYGAKRVMASEMADSFAVRKDVFWDRPEKFLSRSQTLADMQSPVAIERAQTLSLRANWEVKGNTATMLDTAKTAPKGEAIGDVDPNQKFQLSVYARSLDRTGRLLDRRLSRIAEGRQGFADDTEIASKFGADQKSVDAINAWAKAKGLDVGNVDMRTGRMQISGTAENMQTALGTKFQEWRSPDGKTHRMRSGMYSVDAAVAPHFESILGGDNRPAMLARNTGFTPLSALAGTGAIEPIGKIEPNKIATPIPDAGTAPGANADGARPGPIEPRELGRARGLTPDMDGHGKVVAMGELGGDLDLADNAQYYTSRGMEVPDILKKGVNGNQPKSDGPNGADGEVALDSQVVGAIAPKAKQVIAFGENSDAGFPDTHNEMAFPTDGAPAADVISWSWGQFASNWTQQARRTMNMSFKRSGVKGVTTFVAAGDDGALDRNPNRHFDVDFPAESPYVTGVGGTLITMSAGKVVKEVSWNDGPNSATGGGISEVEPRPDFQKGLKMPANINGTKFDGRGVPDVAENASPRSGYVVRVGGQEGAIGGTSGGAPAWSAYTAAIGSKLNRNFGNMNPFFYANSNSGMFNDITEGDNRGYKSGVGWDAVTGNGSGKLQEMTDVLQKDKAMQGSLRRTPWMGTDRMETTTDRAARIAQNPNGNGEANP